MFDRELWLFINTFAEWLSALGTIAAVVVALRLARRDSRVRLRVVAGIRLILQGGVEDRPAYLSIEITNIGRRPAQITSIVMRDGFARFRFRRFRLGWIAVMFPPQNALSARVPTTIGDGERAHYLTPWPEFEKANREQMREVFGGQFGRIRARLFRIGVDASAGGTFDVRIERELAQRLVDLAKRRDGKEQMQLARRGDGLYQHGKTW